MVLAKGSWGRAACGLGGSLGFEIKRRPKEKGGVSLAAASDQRLCLWKPPPFGKGGPKLQFACGAGVKIPLFLRCFFLVYPPAIGKGKLTKRLFFAIIGKKGAEKCVGVRGMCRSLAWGVSGCKGAVFVYFWKRGEGERVSPFGTGCGGAASGYSGNF